MKYSESKDKLLFTPGPLTTSPSVKQAAQRDLGSRDSYFMNVIKEVQSKLLKIAGLKKEDGFEAILMQGAGTFGLEAVVSSAVPKNGKILVVINGAYGERLNKIANIHNIETIQLRFAENEIPKIDEIKKALEENPDITHVSIVHCETTTGILNEIEEIGKLVNSLGKTYIVDAMSSFGAIPIDFEAAKIDYLITSSNKCIEGIPGFSVIIAKKEALDKCQNNSRTMVLDIYSQWEAIEKSGQFRFTPPIQSILAFNQALDELIKEDGVQGRGNRYKTNFETIAKAMREMGFEEYLAPEVQSYIISSYLYPTHHNFDFELFYTKLNARGCVIYPGKLSQADCFRIGSVGRLYYGDFENLAQAIKEVLAEMNVELN